MRYEACESGDFTTASPTASRSFSAFWSNFSAGFGLAKSRERALRVNRLLIAVAWADGSSESRKSCLGGSGELCSGESEYRFPSPEKNSS